VNNCQKEFAMPAKAVIRLQLKIPAAITFRLLYRSAILARGNVVKEYTVENASPIIKEISVSESPPKSRFMGPIITFNICRSMKDKVAAIVSKKTTYQRVQFE
jgi:hypothetical protein